MDVFNNASSGGDAPANLNCCEPGDKQIMSIRPRLALTAATLLLAAFGAQAQSGAVRAEKNISLELANQLASATVAACAANGYAVTATVVDRAGGVRAMQRADNAGPHTLGASERKAYTSASAKAPTRLMLENSQKNPGAATLGDIPGFLLLGGGLPIKAGNEVIGAIGVGGAPGGHLDEQCAQTALDKFKADLS